MALSVNKTQAIAPAAGLAVGAGAGIYAGRKAAASVMAQAAEKIQELKNESGLNLIENFTKDQYVSSRIEENMDNIHNSLRKSKWKDAFSKIAEKAKTDYDKISARVKEQNVVEKIDEIGNKAREIAKNTKVKWIAGLAAAGLAIGSGVALAMNIKGKKANAAANTAEKAQ